MLPAEVWECGWGIRRIHEGKQSGRGVGDKVQAEEIAGQGVLGGDRV